MIHSNKVFTAVMSLNENEANEVPPFKNVHKAIFVLEVL